MVTSVYGEMSVGPKTRCEKGIEYNDIMLCYSRDPIVLQRTCRVYNTICDILKLARVAFLKRERERLIVQECNFVELTIINSDVSVNRMTQE